MATIQVTRQIVEALVLNPGEIKVPRQIVEALVLFPGEIRVARQYIEVLIPSTLEGEDIPVFATSTLSMTDSSSPAGSEHNTSASNTLVLTDSSSSGVKFGIASNTLSLTDDLARSIVVLAESNIALTDSGAYRGPISIEAISTLAMSVSTHLPTEHIVSAISTLDLTQSAEPSGVVNVSASSDLDLSQNADNIEKHRRLESDLTLVQSVDVVASKTVSSQLNLTQEARVDAVIKTASSTLNMTQTVRCEPRPQSASSTLGLSQFAGTQFHIVSASSTLELTQSNVVAKPIRVSAESNLTETEEVWDPDTSSMVINDIGLRQSVAIVGDVNKSATSQLGITQDVYAYILPATAKPGIATSTLVLADTAWGSLILGPTASSTLDLTQTNEASTGPVPDTGLNLTQTISYSVERAARPSSSDLDLGHQVTYILETSSTKHQYSPFVGEVTDLGFPDPPPAAIDGPMAGIQVPFQLVYPSLGSVTDSVSLKTPNLGNKDRLSFNRVLHETRGGTLIVFADPIWPKIQTLVLTFSGLLRTEAHELQTFINDHLGKEIGLIDWEHRYWRGVITSPDEPLIEDRYDSFTTSFEFEGELDPAWNPQVVPASLRYSATRSVQHDGYYVPNEPQLPEMQSADTRYETITDADALAGQPLYIQTINGHLNLAKADTGATAEVIGFAESDVLTGEVCYYFTEGYIERTDWTSITGATELSPGSTYFLDPAIAGRITATAPTTAGQLVVRVGRAVNARTLDIEIELPILL